jgi:hypothetical protein
MKTSELDQTGHEHKSYTRRSEEDARPGYASHATHHYMHAAAIAASTCKYPASLT